MWMKGLQNQITEATSSFMDSQIYKIWSHQSSTGVTVHDEPWPLVPLLAIGPDPVTFASIYVFDPAAVVKSV
jgi:hypothetical protein